MAKSIKNRALTSVGHYFVRAGIIKNPSPGMDRIINLICSETKNPPPETPEGKWQAVTDFYISKGNKARGKMPKLKKPPSTKKISAKQARIDFYYSPEWRALRYEVIKKFGAACQCCGATAKSSGRPIHVDHIKPRSIFPELELCMSNLQILCEDCNMGKGARDQTDWRAAAE